MTYSRFVRYFLALMCSITVMVMSQFTYSDFSEILPKVVSGNKVMMGMKFSVKVCMSDKDMPLIIKSNVTTRKWEGSGWPKGQTVVKRDRNQPKSTKYPQPRNEDQSQ